MASRPGSRLFKENEAAAELDLSPFTLRIWRYQGRGPEYLKIGRNVRYSREALQTYLETRSIKPKRG